MSTAAELCDNSPLVQTGRNMSLARPQSNVDFTVGYYAFGHVFVFICVLTWVLFKNKYERTRIRPTIFVVLAACASLAQMNFGSLQVILANEHPCWLGPVLMVMIVPFGSTAIIGRLLFFSFLSQFAQSASKAFKEESKTRETTTDSRLSIVASMAAGDFASAASVLVTRKQQCVHLLKVIKMVGWKILFPSSQTASKEELYVLKFLGSTNGVFTVAMVMIFPFVVLSLVLLATDPVYLHCTNCPISMPIILTVVVIMILQTSIGIAYWYILHRFNAEDPWGLKSECFYSLIFAIVAFIGLILTGYAPTHTWPYSHQFQISLGIWLFVMEQSIVQLYLARRSEKQTLRTSRKNPIVFSHIPLVGGSHVGRGGHEESAAASSTVVSSEATTSSLETLDMILRSKEMSDAFEKQLVAEYGVESLFFVRDVEAWKRQYHDLKPLTRLTRARRMYKAYILPNGLYTVNIPYDIAEEVRKGLSNKKSPSVSSPDSSQATVDDEDADDVSKTLFDEAHQEVRQLLANGAVRRFCNTDTYQSILQQTDLGQIIPLNSPSSLLLTNAAPSSPSPTPSTKRYTSHHV